MITLYIVCKYSHNNSVDILERDSLLLLIKSSSSAKLWHFSEVECLAWGFNCLHDNCWFWMMEISMNIGMLRPIRKTEFISIATNNVQNNYHTISLSVKKKLIFVKVLWKLYIPRFQDWDWSTSDFNFCSLWTTLHVFQVLTDSGDQGDFFCIRKCPSQCDSTGLEWQRK